MEILDDDDGGLAIVRVKPIGAGGGGVEASGVGLADGKAALRYATAEKAGGADGGGFIRIVPGPKCTGKEFRYMRHVVPPSTDNATLYEVFMPRRVAAFLTGGLNVNVMAYGQTGTGKTHTMFGTPGIMGRAGSGEFGLGVSDEYGFFPRGVLDIFARVQAERAAGADVVLTASAVELCISGNVDMLRDGVPLSDGKGACGIWSGSRFGVSLDKATKPARLYGMEALPLESEADVLRVFAAIATRCTAGTGLNHSSSRSHCFAFLHLHRRDRARGAVATTRFQFVDLAGNERQEDANGPGSPFASQAGMEGFMTNFSLLQLSAAVRGLVDARRTGRAKSFSFRTYLGDLVPLLSESMTGAALTAVVVCASQAPANAAITANALDFGAEFAKLRVRPKRVKAVRAVDLEKMARALLKQAEAAMAKGCSKKYITVRAGQIADCHAALRVLQLLGCGGAGDGSGDGDGDGVVGVVGRVFGTAAAPLSAARQVEEGNK